MAMITCEPRSNGNVEIIGSGPLNASEASLLIAEIAKAVTLAHKRSGRPLPSAADTDTAKIPCVEISALGLIPGEPTNDYVTGWQLPMPRIADRTGIRLSGRAGRSGCLGQRRPAGEARVWSSTGLTCNTRG